MLERYLNVMDKMPKGIVDGAENFTNLCAGYICEQSLTSFNILHVRLMDSLKKKFGSQVIEPDDISEWEDHRRCEKMGNLGILLGMGQDMASLIGTYFYLQGSDSEFAALSATIVGTKFATNIISAVSYKLYGAIGESRGKFSKK